MTKLPGKLFPIPTMILRPKERNPLPSPSLFLKKKIETTAAGITSIAAACGVNGKQLTSQYKAFISQYREWDRLDHASEYVLFKQNIGPSLCIDETSLSCGELYTVVTNRAGRGGRGTLVSMIRGTKSEDVIRVLEMIHLSKRKTVKEVTLDLSPTMMRIVRTAFPNATMTNGRFHVQKLFYEAIDELRITYRRMARDLKNDEIQRCREQNIAYVPFRYTNGDTREQLLARAKHVLVKHFSKWTDSQRIRAEIIFEH
ncbi:transposase, partial [uncultured Bacteroides sp.]|uniref:ISAon1 family transposase n=1 Tax=uncultured Bacteroides sp. TaxID=162156 RepID=UPI00272C1D6F